MDALFLANPPNHLSRPLLRSKSNSNETRRNFVAPFRSPIKCAAGVALGGGGSYSYENMPKFPRMNVWDPYKRLGVSPYASEEEIRGARNFLIEQFAGHERSVESIEAAYEKIIMKSFRERKKSKINLKSRLKKKVEESPSWVKRLLDFVELPATDVILKRMFLFAFMGAWSVMSATDAGPAFQVALSLGSCIYFLNDKMKNALRASLTGFGALILGWIVGSVLVPVIPSNLIQPTWTLELMTALVSYVFLFLACTFLK